MAGRDTTAQPAGDGPILGLFTASDLARLRRRWYLPVIAAVAVAAVLYVVAMLAPTTYSAQAALQLLNKENTPSQETLLVDGFVDFFNQPSTQADLRQKTGIGSGVTLTASPAAAGPILYVAASATDGQTAQDAATKAAQVFSTQLNKRITDSKGSATGALREASPSSVAVMQTADSATKITQSKAKAVAPWVALTMVLAVVAAMVVPERGRRREGATGSAGPSAPERRAVTSDR